MMSSKKFSRIRKLLGLSVVGILALTAVFSLVTRPMSAAPNTVYTNSAPITINTTSPAPTPASLYPSPIVVSGMTGTTTKITLTLTGITHTRLNDVNILLVSPTGVKFIPFANVMHFNNTGVSGLNVTLDDAAATQMPTGPALTSGTFRPSAYASPSGYPAPAPASPYIAASSAGGGTFANTMNGADPNGTWNLYVVDDTLLQSGTISGGWSMSVTTTGTAATVFSNSASINLNDVTSISSPATPYPSSITVSGETGVVSDVNVTIDGFSHTRPDDVEILLVSPNGVATVLMADVGCCSSVSNLTITFDDEASGFLPGGSPLTSGLFKPTNSGAGTFLPPAPPPPYNSFFAGLDGFSPNGVWSLYVLDDLDINSGSISGGWSLEITTTPYVPPTISCAFPSFSAAPTLSVGSSPTGIAHGDFNGDTKEDLVVTNQGANNVSVMLGDGAGGFSTATNFGTGTSPYAVAVGTFNADANVDLVVVNSGSNNVSILLGNGMGGFGSPTNFGVGISPISVAVGNFNGDSNADLAVANFGGFFAGTVSVLLGTGTGTFGPATNYGVRTQPSFVAIGEFNGDMNADLAVANFGSNNISILTGVGNGTFTAAPNVNVGLGPVAIAIADYNLDGKSDLAVANYNADDISIRLGTGAATFTNTGSVLAGTNPISLSGVDLSSDGLPDLVVANSGSNDVRVLFNAGGGGFGFGFGTGSFAVGTGPNALVTGDFNDDDRTDFATANSGGNSVSVALNGCAVAKGNRFDFDGDRRTDISVFRPSNGTWYISPNGAGQIFGTSTDKIVPEDYNGDGRVDLAYFRPSTGRWVVPGIYNVEFGVATDIPIPADFDGDGRADLAVYRPSEGAWYIRRSIDNNWMTFLFGTSEDRPVPRDYDGDGKADIAVFRPSEASWYIIQSSNGLFRGQQFGITTDRAVPADYDGDGKADIAVFRPADGAWYIYKSSDNGFLAYAWGLNGDIPVQGDFDGDGKFDIAVYRPSAGSWYILRSTDGTFQAVNWGVSTDIPVPSAYVQ
jgi:subtilisin-like proprotein convertase family protein